MTGANYLMRFLLKHKRYSRLIFANIISRFGDSIDMIAFSWLIYKLTGSATWSAIIVGVNQVVSVLFQPIVGGYVEDKNKKKLLVISDLIRAILIFVLTGLYFSNFVDKTILVIFTISISFVETFRIPSGVAIIPMLLSEEAFEEGISLNNAFSKASELIGLFSTGILIGTIGAMGAIFIDGITFLISALLIMTIHYEDTSIKNEASHNYFTVMQDGFLFLIRHNQLLLICIMCALINAIVVPFDSLQAVYINLYFDGNVHIMSAISVALAIGMILGSFSYNKIIKNRYSNDKKQILKVGGIAIGIFYIGIFLTSSLSFQIYVRTIIVVLLSLFVGVFIAYLNAYVQVFFVQNVHKDYLARIAAIATTITIIGSPISAFIVAGLTNIMACKDIFLLTGIVAILVFLILSNKIRIVKE